MMMQNRFATVPSLNHYQTRHQTGSLCQVQSWSRSLRAMPLFNDGYDGLIGSLLCICATITCASVQLSFPGVHDLPILIYIYIIYIYISVYYSLHKMSSQNDPSQVLSVSVSTPQPSLNDDGDDGDGDDGGGRNGGAHPGCSACSRTNYRNR